jgi:4-alpha-glucanotransferase
MMPFQLRLPEQEARGAIEWTLSLEDGATRQWRADLEELPLRDRQRIDSIVYVALDLPATGTVPWGYHRLTLDVAGQRLESTLIASPRRAYQSKTASKKQWGVFLPLYALHSQRSQGVGDLTDLRDLLVWASRQGGGFAGTLPLLASFLDKPFDPSPYAPVSRLFWNELFIDLESPVAPVSASTAQQPGSDRSRSYRIEK